MNIDLKCPTFYVHPPNMIFASSKKFRGDNICTVRSYFCVRTITMRKEKYSICIWKNRYSRYVRNGYQTKINSHKLFFQISF